MAGGRFEKGNVESGVADLQGCAHPALNFAHARTKPRPHFAFGLLNSRFKFFGEVQVVLQKFIQSVANLDQLRLRQFFQLSFNLFQFAHTYIMARGE